MKEKELSGKLLRNRRIVYISQYFITHPNQLISLSYFCQYFDKAKSSISEDIDFVKQAFRDNHIGEIETVTGANGGRIFRPSVSQEEAQQLIDTISEMMQERKRILPGNYVYVADILQDPMLLDKIARVIATRYQHKKIDAVVTIETKGIGLCVSVAKYLNVPYVVARRSASDMDGSTISINYLSGSHQRVSKMELSKSSLNPGGKVLIVDDFLRNGGTIVGLISLIEEFECEAVGVCVFVESAVRELQALPEYQSFFKVEIVYNNDTKKFELQTRPGSFFDTNSKK